MQSKKDYLINILSFFMIMFIIDSNYFVIDNMKASFAIFVLCTTPSLLVRFVISRLQVKRVVPNFNVGLAFLCFY